MTKCLSVGEDPVHLITPNPLNPPPHPPDSSPDNLGGFLRAVQFLNELTLILVSPALAEFKVLVLDLLLVEERAVGRGAAGWSVPRPGLSGPGWPTALSSSSPRDDGRMISFSEILTFTYQRQICECSYRCYGSVYQASLRVSWGRI